MAKKRLYIMPPSSSNISTMHSLEFGLRIQNHIWFLIQSYMIPVACFICFVTCLIWFFLQSFCRMINEKLSSISREKVELEDLHIGIVVLNLLLLNRNLLFYWRSWWWGRWWHWWRSWWWGRGWFRWARWGWN